MGGPWVQSSCPQSVRNSLDSFPASVEAVGQTKARRETVETRAFISATNTAKTVCDKLSDDHLSRRRIVPAATAPASHKGLHCTRIEPRKSAFLTSCFGNRAVPVSGLERENGLTLHKVFCGSTNKRQGKLKPFWWDLPYRDNQAKQKQPTVDVDSLSQCKKVNLGSNRELPRAHRGNTFYRYSISDTTQNLSETEPVIL